MPTMLMSGQDIRFLSVKLLKLLLLFGFADYSIVSQKQAVIMSLTQYCNYLAVKGPRKYHAALS